MIRNALHHGADAFRKMILVEAANASKEPRQSDKTYTSRFFAEKS
jgi:hypothetical protein